MKQRVGTLFALGAALMLPACAGAMGHTPPVGGIYAGAKGVTPNTVADVTEGARPGPMTGKSCAMGVLGLASWGDMSIEKAKADSGITEVATLDYKTMDILGVVFQMHCTMITGSDVASPGGSDDGMGAPAPAPAAAPTAAPAPAPAPAPGGEAPPPPPPPPAG